MGMWKSLFYKGQIVTFSTLPHTISVAVIFQLLKMLKNKPFLVWALQKEAESGFV